MSSLNSLSISLWEVQGEVVLIVRASQLQAKGRDRHGFIRELFAGNWLRLSCAVLILEDAEPSDPAEHPRFTLGRLELNRASPDYSSRAIRDTGHCLGFAAAAAHEFALVLGRAVDTVVLVNTQETFRVVSAGSLVSTTRLAGRATAGAAKLLPTAQASHRLSSGIEISIVDAGQPLLLVRADAIGASGRETIGKRFKNRLSVLQWDELYDQVSGILDPDDRLEVRLLGLERARELPMVWIAPPGNDYADMDCSVRYSVDGKLVSAMPGAAQLTLIAAACVPGTVLQQVTRTLPGLDCRLGLGSQVLVASAETQSSASGQSRLLSLTMHQTLRCLLRGQSPL